ncbi:MAG: PD-(D/E)XK nuclease family protein [Elusimicrobiota bacterium]
MDKLPRPLSHSSISCYEECPRKWHFRYIEKIPQKPRHFFSFGKTLHNVLEYFYKVEQLPPPDLDNLLEYYRQNWITEGYASAAQEDEYRTKGRRIIEDYYHKHIDGFRLPYSTEYPFNFEVSGVKVTGFIDRIDKLPDGSLSIIDYKTGKEIPLARVKKDPQLTMYQLACEEVLGATVGELVFYHLNSQTSVATQRHSADQVKVLRDRIVTVAEKILADQFEPLPHERKCGWCDYKDMCPVFNPAAAAAAKPAEQLPLMASDKRLSKLVDRYGKMKEDIRTREAKADELKQQILDAVGEQDSRVLGSSFEASVHFDERWEFKDKSKVLAAIERAGYWDRIIAPSAPAVQKLMKDPNLPLDLQDTLRKLGKRAVQSTLRVKKVAVEEG